MDKAISHTRVYFLDHFPCSGDFKKEIISEENRSFDIYRDSMYCVQLIRRPSISDLRKEDDKDQYRYILPESNLSSCAVPQVSIAVSGDEKERLFWETILCLRLVIPLRIGVSGFLDYENIPDQLCDSFGLHRDFTVLNYENFLRCCDDSIDRNGLSCSEKYKSANFKEVNAIFKYIRDLKAQKDSYQRIVTAINMFADITNGSCTSYWMLHQGLLSCLECLVGSPGKGDKLGELVSPIVRDHFSDVENFIKEEYKNKRNHIAHGNPQFFSQYGRLDFSVSKEDYIKLYKLHEITRCAIRRFLLMPKEDLVRYSKKINSKPTQDFIKSYNFFQLNISIYL